MASTSDTSSTPWGERRTAVVAKSAMLNVYPEEDMAFTSCVMITFIPNNLIVSDTPSVSFALIQKEGDEPQITPLPVVAKFEGTNDIAVVYIKQSKLTYLVGIPIDVLIAWKPPQGAREDVIEDALFVQHKVPNAKLLSILPLAKTSTHDLPAMLDKLLSHCPSFKHALVRSIADMKKHTELDYDKAAERACDAGCARDRAAAKDKGASSRDPRVSGVAGQASKKKWDELKVKLVGMKNENFALPFEQRYLKLPVDEKMVPTKEGMKRLMAELASHPCGEALLEELPVYEDDSGISSYTAKAAFRPSPLETKSKSKPVLPPDAVEPLDSPPAPEPETPVMAQVVAGRGKRERKPANAPDVAVAAAPPPAPASPKRPSGKRKAVGDTRPNKKTGPKPGAAAAKRAAAAAVAAAAAGGGDGDDPNQTALIKALAENARLKAELKKGGRLAPPVPAKPPQQPPPQQPGQMPPELMMQMHAQMQMMMMPMQMHMAVMGTKLQAAGLL